MIVDAHFHCWRLDRGDYGWLTPALGPIHRDVSIADWERVARPHGVRGGVLVQAAPTEAETHFLLAQAKAHPSVLGVVGWLDLAAADAPARIAALAAEEPLLRGLRPMLHDLPDPGWIEQPAVAPALDSMAAWGLVFDALVRPVHLPALARVCARHPALQVVIDHAAKPAIAAGEWEPWAEQMRALARAPNVVCKLSGLLTESDGAPVRRWALHLLDSFGADRLLWGSDWPVLERAADYARWWDEVHALLPAADRDAVLGTNARRVYRV